MVNQDGVISNPKKAFWKFSFPLIALSIFQALYSFVDMFWASQLSSSAFFAIGVTAPLVSLITYSGDSMGIGTNSIMSRELGRNAYDETYNSLLHGIIGCFAVSAFFMISSLFIDEILGLMHVTTSLDLAAEYIAPMLLFSSVMIFSSLFVNTLQAEGNSRIPTILLIMSNVLNLILDPILMFDLGWGVVGAAYATIISSAIVVVFLLYWYLAGKTEVSLSFRHFKPGIVYDIFIVAVPNFVVKGLWCFAMMYVNKVLIDQLGELGVLLYSTSTQIETLILSPVKGFAKAQVTVCGKMFGGDMLDTVKDIYHYALKFSFLIVAVCAVIFFFVRDYAFALFSVTNVSTAVFYIAVFGSFILLGEAVSSISSKILDGMGKSYHMFILENGTIILELLAITFLAPVLTSGACILIGILISEVIFAFIYYIVMRTILNGTNRLEKRIGEKMS